VDHILAVLFGEELFFANAGIFRREMHDHLVKLPETQHVIVDAVAIADIDYTGMTALSQVVADLDEDKISFSFSRANDTVKERLKKSTNAAIKTIALFDSTDAAAVAAEAATKA
jgi:SulP family sulfate permease